MNFGKALRTIRLLEGLSQKEAASLLHMDDRTLRNIETDKTRITAEQVEHFARIYAVDIDLIYHMAKEQVSFQNILHESKRGSVVPIKSTDSWKELFDPLLSRLEILESRFKELDQS